MQEIKIKLLDSLDIIDTTVFSNTCASDILTKWHGNSCDTCLHHSQRIHQSCWIDHLHNSYTSVIVINNNYHEINHLSIPSKYYCINLIFLSKYYISGWKTVIKCLNIRTKVIHFTGLETEFGDLCKNFYFLTFLQRLKQA